MTPKKLFLSTAKTLSQPAIVFYTLPALMLVLIAGTVVQGGIGIYEAQKLYFSSFILWVGPLPLPGGASLLGLLALNLTLKFILFSEWHWKKAGIILSHLGALTLLVGGLLTALLAQEGYMAIAEGQTSPYVYDHHARELTVFKDDKAVFKILFEGLKTGIVLNIPGAPFTITPLDSCLNCTITRRAETVQDFMKDPLVDLAQKMALSGKPLEKEDETNMAGVSLWIEGTGSTIAFEGMPRPLTIGAYKIILGKAQRTLPFALELKDFRKEDHPGTGMAKGFSSDVIVHDSGIDREAQISMNQPLRYKGYTFYQSSFEQSADAEMSVFSVVENKGRLVPYIATIIIAAGLLLHLIIRLRGSGIALILLASFFLLPSSPHAAPAEFKTLPIQHEGRIKPLDSFARVTLARIAGVESLEGKPAIDWLAQSVFDPATAASRPLFKVAGEKERLSYADLGPRIAKTSEEAAKLLALPPASLTQDQKDLLALHENFAVYSQILRSLTAVLPLSVPAPAHFKHLGKKDYALSYIDFSRLKPEIDALVKDILKRKGEKLETYTEEELRTAQLSFALDQIRAGSSPNALLAIIPPLWGAPAWQTPWQTLLSGGGSPAGAEILKNWQDMGLAYQKNDDAAWEEATKKTKVSLKDATRPAALSAEVMYHAYKPYNWAMVAYALSFLAFVFHGPRLLRARWPLAITAVSGAIIIHATAILLRIYILERPPVGTLYESVLFVGLVAAVIGWIVSIRTKSLLPLGAGAMAALILLAVAPVTAPDASKLDVLGAVLNTNFWLGTHVIMITAGYGLCILAGVLAHVFLWGRSKSIFNTVYKLSLASLLFTCVGTILGGIWADQSWGRFWGWDPKENGALLIVLWLIWAQHGRLSGHLNETAFAVCMALLNVTVALAWFGVNLLGVGLHSYGFTSGLAMGLFAFCALEALLIGGLWFIGKKRQTS